LAALHARAAAARTAGLARALRLLRQTASRARHALARSEAAGERRLVLGLALEGARGDETDLLVGGRLLDARAGARAERGHQGRRRGRRRDGGRGPGKSRRRARGGGRDGARRRGRGRGPARSRRRRGARPARSRRRRGRRAARSRRRRGGGAARWVTERGRRGARLSERRRGGCGTRARGRRSRGRGTRARGRRRALGCRARDHARVILRPRDVEACLVAAHTLAAVGDPLVLTGADA